MINLIQSTLADSVSHRIYPSGVREAGTPGLAAETKVKGGQYGDCTQAHPMCRTGYGISRGGKSQMSFWEAEGEAEYFLSKNKLS